MLSLDRRLLAAAFPGQPLLVSQFEALAKDAAETASNASDTAQATQALNEATVLVLSSNEAFANERTLKLAPGLRAADDGSTLTISIDRTVARVDGFSVTLSPQDDATLAIQQSGTVVVRERPIVELVNAATDAAAATGGVPIGGLYHNAGAVRVRLA